MISYIDNISNVVQEITLTIHPADWSSYLDGYVFLWTDARVATGSSVDVDFIESTVDSTAPVIEYEKQSHAIQFYTDIQPTDNIAVVIRIINAQADLGSSIRADTVQSDAVESAANVEEALTVLDAQVASNTDAIAKLTLKNGGTATGTNVIQLPSNWEVAYLTVYRSQYYVYSFTITKYSLATANENYFRSSFDNQNNCSVFVTNTSVNIHNVTSAGSDSTAASTIKVAYV